MYPRSRQVRLPVRVEPELATLPMIPVLPHHPLPRGTRIVTLQGEVELNQNDAEVVTQAGAIGRITGIGKERDNGDPGFCYDLEFDNGAWFTRDDFEFDDATRYRVLPIQ